MAIVAVIAGLSSLVITLQFLDVIPWAGEKVEFFYGKWAGVFLYSLETIVLFAVAVGWLTLKPWAPMFTLIFALLGFSVPMMSYFAGTSLFSAALAPMLLSVVIVVLSLRPSVRSALAEAASENTSASTTKKPARKKGKQAAGPSGLRSDDV